MITKEGSEIHMKRILSGILIGVVSYSAIFLLLFFSKEITQGIQNGIDICLSLMILQGTHNASIRYLLSAPK